MGLDRFRDISGRGGGNPPRRRFPGGGNGGGDGDSIGRVPPHNIEAEMAVLGAMLLGDRSAVERGLELLSRDDFYRDAHAQIFDAMITLNTKGEPIDIITLQNEMNQLGTLDGIGIEYLLQLSDVEFTTSNIAYYAQIVSEKATLRRLIEAASQIAGSAYGEVDEVPDLVDRAEKLVFEVARKRSGQGFTPLRPLLTEVFEKLDTVYQDKGVVTGVDTGFADLNAMTSGLQEGDLFILAARPSMGKTSLAMGIGQNACLPQYGSRSVAVFSLEMSKEQLVQRLICSEARVDAHRMRTGFLQDNDWDRISAAVQRLWDARLFIDDTTEMSSLEMRARCRRLQAEHGLDLVIVDYLQLMRGTGKNESNRNEEITSIARGLKGLAREMRVPVIALSQLSRAVERREDKRPMLSDLRECLVGSTRLYDAVTGRMLPISDVKPGDRVLAVNGEQKVVAATVSQTWRKGVKPVFRLTTETGRVIEATGNHPFLTQHGYKPLSELVEDEHLLTIDLERWAESDLLWERVRSIEPAGEQETFDICVPETGNFLAEGITVHNSGAIEAEADLVAFIYRPAYYERKQEFNKEAQDAPEPAAGEEFQGEEAEVIIAKHRNGPTGTVKMAFLPKYARFDNLYQSGDSNSF